ncbi:DsrE family protein [Marinomonas pollencensis]|uniref:tRNA 2-thiouridine synthesizing protein C n=1 Tax=Marinomonas pollencensis TaxID=491954 RepID=A0A3E0DT63_9GAMM|nr:DsrE family protein [Marinomonas pollencensis]REG86747.1 tRNA 2-thiouridine synthesizing protein C [Marinomonas pollencensis]
MNNTLIHLSSSPFSSLSCKEGLDLALVLATFEQPVDLCLSGAAIALLYSGQNPNQTDGKHLYKLLDGLTFYDIENVYVEANNGLIRESDIWPNYQALDTPSWHALFSQYQHVFRF